MTSYSILHGVLQSIPCSIECKIVGQILLDHPLSYALTATVDVPALPVETPENPFVTPANIQTIEAFMNRVGYQGVVDKVDIPMEQPQPVVFTQGTHRSTPRAIRSSSVFASPHERKKRKQIAGESSSPRKSLKVTIKQNKYSHLPGALRMMCRSQGYMIKNVKQKCVTNAKFWKTHEQLNQVLKIGVSQLAEKATNDLIESNMKPRIVQSILEDRDAYRSKVLKRKFEKYSTSNTSCREDYFHSKHDEHQDDDALSEREKRVKRHKSTKRSKSVRGSSSKHSTKDSTTYVSKQQSQQQEWDAWEEEIFLMEMRIEATLKDLLSDQFRNVEEYAYHLEQSTNFMENQIVWESKQKDIPRTRSKTPEKKYILSLNKIHAEEFPKPDLEEKLNRWVRKKFKTFNEEARLSIQHWKDSWYKRVSKQNQKKVRKNPEDYYLNHKITKVVRIVTDQLYGLDFMEQILVMRANNKPESFYEADFKYLNKNDIEDLYYLYRSRKIDNREIKLMNSLITFIRNRVIWERVHDFQLGIESYQIRVNLTAPTLTFPRIEEYAPYSTVDKPQTGLIYLNSKDEK
nr:hypothetical protein [Tanacetum cinerariifolium]